MLAICLFIGMYFVIKQVKGINMAYQRKGTKNGWTLFLLVLTGIVLGGFIGSLAQGVPYLKWLDFGYKFGMVGNPLEIDLKVIELTFKILIRITVSSILGVALSLFVYRKL